MSIRSPYASGMSNARRNLQRAILASVGPEGEFPSANEMARRAVTRGYADNEVAFAKAVNRAKSGETNIGLDMVEAIANTLSISVGELLDPEGYRRKGENEAGLSISGERYTQPTEWLDVAPQRLSFAARSLIIELLKADKGGIEAEEANALLTVLRLIQSRGNGAREPMTGAD